MVRYFNLNQTRSELLWSKCINLRLIQSLRLNYFIGLPPELHISTFKLKHYTVEKMILEKTLEKLKERSAKGSSINDVTPVKGKAK